MSDKDAWDDQRLFKVFAVLREHAVELAGDFADRVQANIVAEDDGRFGPPSIRDILGDLTGNASSVFTNLSGLGPSKDEDSDGES